MVEDRRSDTPRGGRWAVARGLFGRLPIVGTLASYQPGWFRKDLAAGLALSALLVPVGMGYAAAAGLPPITGLYATIIPLVAYAIVGPSRILVLGPDSSLAPLIAATVLPLAAGDVSRSVSLAGALAVMTGLLCIVGGIARFGFLAELVSLPVRYGYMNGIALAVIVGQLPAFFGLTVSADAILDRARETLQALAAGGANPLALSIGCASLVIILGCRRWAPRIPGVLVAVVGATVLVGVAGLDARLAVVGSVPRGLPGFSLPGVALSDLAPLLAGAIGIALVSFADTSVLSRTYAGRGGYRVDPNRELGALGVANLAGGLFGGFPVSSSASRTPVAEAAGAQSQVTGLVGAAVITLILLLAPDIVRNVPMATLAAVVIASAVGLIEVAAVRRLYRVRRSEFLLSLASFLGVAVLGVIPGIGFAIILSLLDFVRRAWRPYDAVLGRARDLKGYHDLTRTPGAVEIPGLLLYRWDAPLFFANADLFRERIEELVDRAGRPVRWVVVAAEPITDVDSTAAEMLRELDEELGLRGIDLGFAEMKSPVRDHLERYGLAPRIGTDRFFPTVGVAVKSYLDEAGVEWTDWEDEKPSG